GAGDAVRRQPGGGELRAAEISGGYFGTDAARRRHLSEPRAHDPGAGCAGGRAGGETPGRRGREATVTRLTIATNVPCRWAVVGVAALVLTAGLWAQKAQKEQPLPPAPDMSQQPPIGPVKA